MFYYVSSIHGSPNYCHKRIRSSFKLPMSNQAKHWDFNYNGDVLIWNFWNMLFYTACVLIFVCILFWNWIESDWIRLIDETWIKSFDWLSVWREQMEIGYRCRRKKRVWWNEIKNGRKKHFEGVFGSHPSSPLVDSMTLIHIERQFALTRKVRVQIACYRHLHIRTITWENGLRYLIKWRGLALQTN